MNKLPQVQVSFFFTGNEINLENVTEVMGIKPTFARYQKDFPIKEIAKTCWALDTQKESCRAISVQFEKIIGLLDGKELEIKDICDKYNCEAGFLINIWMENGDKPEMVLTKEIVSYSSSLNAEIGFDLFVD